MTRAHADLIFAVTWGGVIAGATFYGLAQIGAWLLSLTGAACT